MGISTGLAALKAKQQEHAEREAARNRPKAEYFNWNNNKKASNPNEVLVQFLQELDPSAVGYNEEFGLALAAVEHEAPGAQGFKSRALCTLDDEGQCYACERRKADYQEGWKTKTNFYVNALVAYNDGKGDPEVVVVSRNFNQTFVQKLMRIAVEEGTITNTVFRITKYGSGTQLVWDLEATKKDLFDTSDVEVHDVKETVLRDIEYDKQAEWYGRYYEGPEDAAPSVQAKSAAPAASASDDVEW